MKTIFFDLDGTLTDSAPGIVNSVAYALEKMGHPPMSRAEMAYSRAISAASSGRASPNPTRPPPQRQSAGAP